MTDNQAPLYNRQNRVHSVDLLRGFAMVYIMLYHLFYDLSNLARVPLPFFYTDWWEAVHILFVSLLFAVSGVSTHFSRNSLKRGVIVFFLGQLITLATAAFGNITSSPDIVIVFGVLTFIGLSMMIYSLIRPGLEKIGLPWGVLFAVSVVLYVLFLIFPVSDIFNANNIWLYPLGIYSYEFTSADYFPLVPYFFVFLAGTALAEPILKRKFPEFFYTARFRPLEFIGRHSLAFYIIHQPVFMILLILLDLAGVITIV
jgi:uncharacterized membrane protein